MKWRHSHLSAGQECGDLASDSEVCGCLVCHCIGTQTLATSPSHIPPLHHKILFCFALQTNICYNWKNIWVRVEVAYDPENCFCIVQIEFQINTALNDRLCIILTNTVPRCPTNRNCEDPADKEFRAWPGQGSCWLTHPTDRAERRVWEDFRRASWPDI